MDSLQTAFSSIMVLAILILMVVFLCRYLGPRASAWFRSNREEKIGLSKSKLFNANGYMISGSDFLQLSSNGSFKRFDSIDRDYKQVGQSSLASAPTWNIPPIDNSIPPQPLRPAPAPAPTLLIKTPSSATIFNNTKPSAALFTTALANSMIVTANSTGIQAQIQTQIIDRPLKHKSLDLEKSSTILSTVIPRPTTKRHASTPSKLGSCLFIGTSTATPNNHRNNNNNNNIASHQTSLNHNINNMNNNNNYNNINSNLQKYKSCNEMPLTIDLSDSDKSTSATVQPTVINQTSNMAASQNMAAQNLKQQQRHHKRTISSSSLLTNTNPFLNDITCDPFKPVHILDNPQQIIPYNGDVLHCDTITHKNRIKAHSTYSLPITSPKSPDYINFSHQSIVKKRENNQQIFYRDEIENKNPFTADCVRLVQQQYGNQETTHSLPQLQTTNNYNDDVFDLLPIMKEPPKTDLDRQSIFDFEPDRISSILMTPITNNLPSTPTNILEHFQSTSAPANAHQIQQSPSAAAQTSATINLMENQSSPSSISSVDAPLSGGGEIVLGMSTTMENRSPDKKKYLDSPCSDVFDDIETILRKHFRNRSFSETEATELDLKNFSRNITYNSKTPTNTNPFLDKNTTNMHKTFSENFLAKTSSNNQTWSFGRSLSRQDSGLSIGRRNSSHGSLNDSDRGSIDSINIQRAISCESVSSQSSVILSDLEPVVPPVTGQLCVGLQYDKNSITDVGVELVVTVMEAKELIGPSNLETFDTFVRIYLVPDETGAMQTKLFKNSSSPSYNETFCFWLNKNRGRRSLWFHLYHSGSTHTLIGEAELQISEVTVARPLTTWLPLSDSRQNNAKWGELMFSLSYLPTAERLTVVVVKARNLKLEKNGQEILVDTQSIFVKVYLLKDDRKVSKKKTSLKRKDRCPIFNESMIFSIPPYILNSLQVRLTVMSVSDTEILPIGHIIVGSNTNGKGIRHWNQMLSSLRKPIAMWHQLRKTSKTN